MGKHFGLISVFLICSGCQATTELSTLHLFCGLTESKKVLQFYWKSMRLTKKINQFINNNVNQLTVGYFFSACR